MAALVAAIRLGRVSARGQGGGGLGRRAVGGRWLPGVMCKHICFWGLYQRGEGPNLQPMTQVTAK